MRTDREHKDSNSDASEVRELKFLSEVEECSELTQRDMAHRAGIALGLTNVLLRNLAQKGYIRVTSAGWKRCVYHLTPKGVTRKLQLTVTYVRRVLDQYQNIRQNLKDQLEPLALNAESKIAMYGTGEFAELVFLGLKDIGIDEIDIYNDDRSNLKFLGMPVREVRTMKPGDYDRVLIATLDEPGEVYKRINEFGVAPDTLIIIFGAYSIRDAA